MLKHGRLAHGICYPNQRFGQILKQRFLTLSRFVDLLCENSTRDLCHFYPDPLGSDRPGIGFRISASAFSLERR